MGMNVGSGGGDDPEVIMDVNTTPLIDVMLVLLVMLIMTIPMQFHSVNLNMPVQSENKKPLIDPVIVTVEIDFDGTVLWNGLALSLEELEEKFKPIGEAVVADQPEVNLRPNKLVAYKHVAAVMASAQRNKVTKIGLVSSESFI